MELAESIAVGLLPEEFETHCPFRQDDPAGVDSEESEAPASDDLEAAREEQENDGGVLGRNLASASPGKEGTVGGPCPPPQAERAARIDTNRAGVRVRVPGTADIPTDIFGFTVAAHHLIPGDAALAPSALKKFMTRGASVTVLTAEGDKQKKIRKYVGYNVNGAHNGVWLPGNYYIRGAASPLPGVSWSQLGNYPWCLNYVAAVARAAEGQFHDTHTQYSQAVKGLLNKMAEILSLHECEHCKPEEINPPFRIKSRLYLLSEYFRGQVQGPPRSWKRPWFTSDRWRDDAFAGGTIKESFAQSYAAALLIPAV